MTKKELKRMESVKAKLGKAFDEAQGIEGFGLIILTTSNCDEDVEDILAIKGKRDELSVAIAQHLTESKDFEEIFQTAIKFKLFKDKNVCKNVIMKTFDALLEGFVEELKEDKKETKDKEKVKDKK